MEIIQFILNSWDEFVKIAAAFGLTNLSLVAFMMIAGQMFKWATDIDLRWMACVMLGLGFLSGLFYVIFYNHSIPEEIKILILHWLAAFGLYALIALMFPKFKEKVLCSKWMIRVKQGKEVDRRRK